MVKCNVSNKGEKMSLSFGTKAGKKNMVAIIIGAVLAAALIIGIVVFVAVKKSQEGVVAADLTAGKLEEVCKGFGGVLEQSDDKQIGSNEDAVMHTYVCSTNYSDEDARNGSFLIMKADSGIVELFNKSMKDEAKFNSVGEIVKQMLGFGETDETDENRVALETLVEKPEYYKGQIAQYINGKRMDGDYVVGYKNGIVMTSNDKMLDALGLNEQEQK